MASKIETKLKKLPLTPGVYLHKDAGGKIIYVGKAARLRMRVRQYFQASRHPDIKTDLLVADIADFDIIETASEIDALFLESELIKRYKPKYNLALRDDKSLTYVRIDSRSAHPTVSLTRRPTDDKANYYGPFYNAYELKRALRLLRRIFPFDEKVYATKRTSLDVHLHLSPGLDQGITSLRDYRANLAKLAGYLSGKQQKIIKLVEREMKQAAKVNNFEIAARCRDQLRALKSLSTQVLFGDQEFIDVTKDQALEGLKDLLQLPTAPGRIEGYDISHLSGTDNVASMVVFSYGLPDKTHYRKFKMIQPGNDDFKHMAEVIKRRFSGKNLEDWPKPDLLLIDGGKGQLSAALEVLGELNLKLPAIGLAKRHEIIIVPIAEGFKEIALDGDSNVRKLLIRIRDESHRFALSYQTNLRNKRSLHSTLEDIPGIGPKTRRKIINEFGSISSAKNEPLDKLIKVVGKAKAKILVKGW